jgi:hypothetical protein
LIPERAEALRLIAGTESAPCNSQGGSACPEPWDGW